MWRFECCKTPLLVTSFLQLPCQHILFRILTLVPWVATFLAERNANAWVC